MTTDSKTVMDSSYKYKRLDLSTNAVRLIQVLKGHKGPIKCKMFETCLDQVEGVPYEALSYVWGNRISTDKIWVDGCPFTVTENLFEAISNLRQSGEDRLLWIDAICIDQSDDAVSYRCGIQTFLLPSSSFTLHVIRELKLPCFMFSLTNTYRN